MKAPPIYLLNRGEVHTMTWLLLKAWVLDWKPLAKVQLGLLEKVPMTP